MAHGVHWPLAIRADGPDATVDVRAINPEGAKLVYPVGSQLPAEGASLEYRFHVANIGQEISIHCRICRVDEPDDPRARAMIGVQFDELSPSATTFITICGQLEALTLSQAEAMVSGLYDPAIILDLDFHALYYNSPYIKLSGIRPRALKRTLEKGTSPFEILGNDPKLDARIAGDAVRLARAVHLAQNNVTNMEGVEYTGTLSYIPVLGPFGDVLAVVQTFRDESAENRMQEHYKTLLAYERERVERMAKLVTGLAHQINTPLGIINTAGSVIESVLDVPVTYMTSSRILDEREMEEVFTELRSTTLLLRRNIARVNLLVTKVKDLSVTQLTSSRELVDLGELVKESISTLERSLKKRGIKVDFQWEDDEHFPWDGYPDHLTRVIQELTQNTMIYGYPDELGGMLDIRISTVDGRNMYLLELHDHGAGINEAVLPQVFEPFVTSNHARALGLGLAIVENIVVNLLRGKIECVSTPGVSTTFSVYVPVRVR